MGKSQFDSMEVLYMVAAELNVDFEDIIQIAKY